MMRVVVDRYPGLEEVLDAHALCRVLLQVHLQVGLASVGVCRCSATARDDMVHPILPSLIVVPLDEMIEQMFVATQCHSYVVLAKQRKVYGTHCRSCRFERGSAVRTGTERRLMEHGEHVAISRTIETFEL